MARKLFLICLSSILLLAAVTVFSGNRTDMIGTEIVVSPQTLVLDWDQGGKVTVHTNIPYADVNKPSLTLNGVPMASMWSDSRGCLVLGFNEIAVEGTVVVGTATLTLTGSYTSDKGVAVVVNGSDTVTVIKKK